MADSRSLLVTHVWAQVWLLLKLTTPFHVLLGPGHRNIGREPRSLLKTNHRRQRARPPSRLSQRRIASSRDAKTLGRSRHPATAAALATPALGGPRDIRTPFARLRPGVSRGEEPPIRRSAFAEANAESPTRMLDSLRGWNALCLTQCQQPLVSAAGIPVAERRQPPAPPSFCLLPSPGEPRRPRGDP